MRATWRRLPTPARAIAVAAEDAVAAVAERDRNGLDAAASALAATDGCGLVLGAVVRSLLEELHPDGLDADDLRDILSDCVRTVTGPWLTDVDAQLILVLLVGALGVHDEDEQAPRPDQQAVASHAALLIGYLLTRASHGCEWYLRAAFEEIQRAEGCD